MRPRGGEMGRTVLVTGSAGLIGRALTKALQAQGTCVKGLDLQASDSTQGDVRDAKRVRSAVQGVSGIVHLAAVSRVLWAERDPDLCRSTNVDGVRGVLEAASEQETQPWLIFASSREVYGDPKMLPVTEDSALRPVNVYGRSKVEGEELVASAVAKGLPAAIVRFSNVFGCVHDHPDRVVPAFTRAALANRPLRVDGAGNVFDFTHVEDVVGGVLSLANQLESGTIPPPIHFVSGVPTSLGQLAEEVIKLTKSASPIQQAPPREHDVGRFWGSFSRALDLLGWSPHIPLRQGLAWLIRGYQGIH